MEEFCMPTNEVKEWNNLCESVQKAVQTLKESSVFFKPDLLKRMMSYYKSHAIGENNYQNGVLKKVVKIQKEIINHGLVSLATISKMFAKVDAGVGKNALDYEAAQEEFRKILNSDNAYLNMQKATKKQVDEFHKKYTADMDKQLQNLEKSDMFHAERDVAIEYNLIIDKTIDALSTFVASLRVAILRFVVKVCTYPDCNPPEQTEAYKKSRTSFCDLLKEFNSKLNPHHATQVLLSMKMNMYPYGGILVPEHVINTHKHYLAHAHKQIE